MHCIALRICIVSCMSLLLAHTTSAHEGHSHDDGGGHAADSHRRAPGVAFGPQEMPTGMLLPQAEGPRPWSDKPVLNDPNRFQIAIVTDRTGGHRPGIWMDAMRKINLLRPEFVVSVGDLIEGYTEDRQQLEREWAEFLGFIETLQMRFFFVAGNHDVINPVQHELWRQKFGDEWYSFDYKGVHFVCLNSEDTRNQIGAEQLAWLTDDLQKHADARWTLVFVHKPLWTYSERAAVSGNPDTTNWKKVESLLAGRPHTIFSGHVHHYTQYERNGGMNYYALATTGGTSRLRGNDYGEFDHIMWLTMEDDGPQLAVLRLDGILPPGVVTEESAERFRKFLELARLEVAPILLDNDQGFAAGDINIRLINEFGEEIQATGVIEGLPLRGLTVDPAQLSLKVGPVGVAESNMRVQFSESIDFSRLRETTLTATISTTGDNPLRAERLVPVVIDRRHTCPQITTAPVIDGIIEPWPEDTYQTPAEPVLLGSDRSWKGADDGSFAFHTAHDADNRLYFAFRVSDERLTPGDRIELLLDGRRLEIRREDPRLRWGAVRVSVAPPMPSSSRSELLVEAAGSDGAATSDYAVWSGRRRLPVEGATYAAQRIDGGYSVEISLPAHVVTRRQGADWRSFQLAVVQHDVDEPGGEKTRILWRGSPEVTRTNRGYGYFVREKGE
ncbi:MAG: metallophosphoesterase [Planctomycetota bacterium]